MNGWPGFEPDEAQVSTMVDGPIKETPAEEPIREGAEILGDIQKYVRRFVAASDAQLVALALWIEHTYALDAAEITGYLNIHSAVKRSGKSLLLEVLAELVHRPMLAANM